jgi:O-antigen/teichoic acid export membrane protein
MVKNIIIKDFFSLNVFHIITLIINFSILIFLSNKMNLSSFIIYVTSMTVVHYLVSIGFLFNIYLLKKFNELDKNKFISNVQSLIILAFPFFLFLTLLIKKIFGNYLLIDNFYIIFLILCVSFLIYIIEILRSYILKYKKIFHLGLFLVSLPIIRLILIFILWNNFLTVWSVLLAYLISDLIIIFFFNIIFLKKILFFKFYSFTKETLNFFLNRINLILFFFIYPIILYLDIFVIYFLFPDTNEFNAYITTSFLVKNFIVLFNPLFQIMFKNISENKLKITYFVQILIFLLFSFTLAIFLNLSAEYIFCNGLISINHCNTELYNKLVFTIPFLVLFKAKLFYQLNKKIYFLEIIIHLFFILLFVLGIIFYDIVSLNKVIIIYLCIIILSTLLMSKRIN